MLSLLHAAFPETSADALAQLSIGQRDALLLSLREWLFGPQLTGLATCPNCGERLELNFGTADIRAEAPPESVEQLSLSVSNYDARFRLPNSLDMLAIVGMNDIAVAQHALLERCLVTLSHDGNESNADELPTEIVTAIVARMAEADPQANTQLALNCPQCGHAWQAVLNIASFFWNEINAWAARTLREVHYLASAYGWREVDILALTPTRRQLYVDMIGA
jgi:hypothetical protein